MALAPEFSRSHLQHLAQRGHVRLDGVPATTVSRRVRAGQRLTLELAEGTGVFAGESVTRRLDRLAQTLGLDATTTLERHPT